LKRRKRQNNGENWEMGFQGHLNWAVLPAPAGEGRVAWKVGGNTDRLGSDSDLGVRRGVVWGWGLGTLLQKPNERKKHAGGEASRKRLDVCATGRGQSWGKEGNTGRRLGEKGPKREKENYNQSWADPNGGNQPTESQNEKPPGPDYAVAKKRPWKKVRGHKSCDPPGKSVGLPLSVLAQLGGEGTLGRVSRGAGKFVGKKRGI